MSSQSLTRMDGSKRSDRDDAIVIDDREGRELVRALATGALHSGVAYLYNKVGPDRFARAIANLSDRGLAKATLTRVLGYGLGPNLGMSPPPIAQRPQEYSSPPAIAAPVEPSKFLDEKQLCSELGISPVTATKWRRNAEGPAFVRVGRLIRYTRTALETWLAERTVGVSRKP